LITASLHVPSNRETTGILRVALIKVHGFNKTVHTYTENIKTGFNGVVAALIEQFFI
jgi:hypothetical protein